MPENEAHQVRCEQRRELFPRRDSVWTVGKKSSIDEEKLLQFLEGRRLKVKPCPMQVVRSLSFVKGGELRPVWWGKCRLVVSLTLNQNWQRIEVEMVHACEVCLR